MTIIYPVPEMFPDNRARFIQIINTCHALAESGTEVILAIGIKKGHSVREILAFYDLPEHPNLKVVRLPILRREQAASFRVSWHGIFNFSLILYLLFRKLYGFSQTALFLRHIKLANFILKFRTLIGIHVLFEVHEIFHQTTDNGRKKQKIKRLEEAVYSKADAIACTSQYIAGCLKGMGIHPEAIHIIRHGIKREWFDTSVSVRSYISYTGSLYSWKGVDTLISAIKYLPDEKLLVVGGGYRLEELKNLAEKEGVAERVEFTGAVPHSAIPEYLSHAKIAALPNTSDNTSLFSSPLKLFEYMACGIPIVASDIPVFREILTDGRNAILFKPDNSESLANSIKRIIDTPELAAKLVSNAKEEAGSYMYERRAEKILVVIKAI